jgi:7,8-dihydropterin-6-yl-methyl-4-(beta-D-ribofuranosyl)aminobenzene 5'-phosphate synthase
MMVITEGENVYCFTGCSHHGILNMVESAHHLTEGKKVNVIGGFHMYNPLTKGLSEKKQDVIETGNLLNSNPNINKIVTGHCTGRDAFKILKGTLGDKLYSLNTGSKITL